MSRKRRIYVAKHERIASLILLLLLFLQLYKRRKTERVNNLDYTLCVVPNITVNCVTTYTVTRFSNGGKSKKKFTCL